MKKIFANLVTVLGVLVALTGLFGTPLVLHQLPISLMLPSDGETPPSIPSGSPCRATLAGISAINFYPFGERNACWRHTFAPKNSCTAA